MIRRREKEIARLVPPKGEGKRLPGLKKFRAAIRVKGVSLGRAVKQAKCKERY